LAKYHPSGSIPIPIDDIIELKLGISIIPQENLTESSGVPGYISRDLTTITVDMKIFNKNPFLYRKIIAHEMAHSLLHRNFYSQFSYSDINGWMGVVQSIDEQDLKRLEWQADVLASLICVPKKELERMVNMAIQRATRNPKFDINTMPANELRKYVSQYLVNNFEFPPNIISWRINEDGLLPPAKLDENA